MGKSGAETARDLYLDLLKRCLTNMVYGAEAESGFELDARSVGLDHPKVAHTMIGLERLDNLQECIEEVLRDSIPGDFVETGVWRGGATIFMRGVLKAHGVTDRRVWVADSFEGLPPPDPERYPDDRDDQLHTWKHLAVTLDDVRANFERYGLLDEQVAFLKGWFRDTLPTAPIERLSVLRLDGDLYESTITALESLYPKLAPGGYIIVDDYGAHMGCHLAVDDFRDARGIEDEMIGIDWSGVYWRKSS
jgi:O-methyltransferase